MRPGGVILSLCDHSGHWSRPYEKAGYPVVRVDLQEGQDIRLLRKLAVPVHGILAAPPCTHFARSGARWWAEKGDAAIFEGLALVDACLRAVAIYRPDWWCLENPIGRLQDYLGEPAFRCDPCDFGDPWTKRIWLWGHFTPPMPLFCPSAVPVAIEETGGRAGSRDRTTRLGSRNRDKRSATPEGFAQAFFEANP